LRTGSVRRAEDEMGDLLQPWHLVVLGVVAFLLFGAKRLPELGKGLGEGLKGFKEGIKGVTDPTPAPPPPPTVQQSVAPPPPAANPNETKQS
jgi:sec-independent protein translocase protein TatA